MQQLGPSSCPIISSTTAARRVLALRQTVNLRCPANLTLCSPVRCSPRQASKSCPAFASSKAGQHFASEFLSSSFGLTSSLAVLVLAARQEVSSNLLQGSSLEFLSKAGQHLHFEAAR
ncbi:hypothetical protein Nepgr_016502 [Nepenthes gracilis]|uniref:Uncharacterized protein n=1 Tax=Nepenthes gracilis TaxID=150966 RepID=A0AAD3SQN6_NEPGR|nr:hypothetical protein Nepgr_016502 [Nepenthes gracilis]